MRRTDQSRAVSGSIDRLEWLSPAMPLQGSAAETTDGSCRIVAEPVRSLTNARKAAVLRAAVAADPLAARLRENLVQVLMSLDQYDEALAVIADWPGGGRSYHAQSALAACRLVTHDPAGDFAARTAADRAAELASSQQERAHALALRSKAERRMRDLGAARVTLIEALALDPANIDACKRLAALLIASGDMSGVIDLTDALLAQGIAHPQVLNARAVAHARLGQMDAARETVGFVRFGHRALLDPPAGYGDVAAFNAAVAEELVAHPARRVDPQGSASRFTTRVDAPTSGHAPLAALLMDQITYAVAEYVNALPPDPHPWRRARPARGIVHGTCAITGADGFETWHIHQAGWLSGVYYVEVPDRVLDADDPAGCIVFGLDEAFAGSDAARDYGETVVRPQPGMLMLFPSHVYHRTNPHGSDGRRICMAFDMWPR